MKREYDLRKGKRGPVIPMPPKKCASPSGWIATSWIIFAIWFARRIEATIRP